MKGCSVAFKRIVDKFKKKFNWDGKDFRTLIVNIFAKGKKTVEERVMQDTFASWNRQKKKLDIELPSVTDYLSSNANLVRVSQIGSKEVTDTLKQQIMGDLRRAIDENQAKGIFKRDNLLSDDVIDSFKGKMKDTFKNYNKKDTVTAGKLETIALTESRNIVNTLKYDYAIGIADSNPSISLQKTWNHYPFKSKEPRKGHREVNKATIDIRALYKVNYYKKVKGNWVLSGNDLMRFPHDPNVGARQNINCHCDISFKIKRRKK